MRRMFLLWRTLGRDLRVLKGELSRPDRPGWLLPAAFALAFFALEPLNFALPVIGAVDDLILLPLLLRALLYLAQTARTGAARTRAESRVVSIQ